MTERDAFDTMADRFGDDLERATAAHPARRGLLAGMRRGLERPGGGVRKRRVAIGGAGLAIAGTAAALVIGIGGGQDLDVIAQARAAVAPGRYILHVRAETAWPTGRGPAGTTTVNDEWSTTTGPTRWRVVQTFTDAQIRSGGTSNLPPRAEPEEFSFEHGTQRAYDRGANVMSVITGFSDTGIASRLPNPFGELGEGTSSNDPMSTVRTLLQRGDVRDAGQATVDGHQVRRLIGTIPSTKGQPIMHVEADVDVSTFAPVRLSVRPTAPKGAAHSSRMQLIIAAIGTQVTDFTAYERLPLTPANERLLEIHPSRGAKITTTSHATLMAKARANSGPCHTAHGVRVCKILTK